LHPVLALLVTADNERFERLWSNNGPNVQVYDLPEVARIFGDDELREGRAGVAVSGVHV
jgi:hypothetical protein